MPQLRLEKSDIAFKVLPMESLKSAVAFVKSLPDDDRNIRYVYVTENKEKLIENTVIIPK